MTAEGKSTKEEILHLLKKTGEMTVSELANHLGITEMAIRRHLKDLESEQMIESEVFRQPMGRPTHRYFLSKRADRVFPVNYHVFAVELLDMIEQLDGGDKVSVLFNKREQRMAREYLPRLHGKSLKDKVKQLAQIQQEKGYMTDWSYNQENNYYELIEHNCPIARVAEKYAQTCTMELSLFQRLLNTNVSRVSCIAQGMRHCKYVIHEPLELG
jgi:iron-sulfur cluster biosynthesis transcriptional regulator SufR